MIKEIVIIGASGLAKEVSFLIEESNKDKKKCNVCGFIDKNNISNKLNNIPIIGTDE